MKGRGYKLTILAFIEKANKIHNNKYDYSDTIYNGRHKQLKINCPKHGIFEMTSGNHLSGRGCNKCNISRKTSSLEKIIENFIKIHNNRYDYSLVDYKGSNKKVKIICREHGIFEQTPHKHLYGRGCPQCKNEISSKRARENPIGWSKTNWFKAAQKSKNFDSFKVYILECWDENEKFYKIGRTFTKIKERFRNKISMPYNFKILKVFEDCAENIYDLESKLKNENKEYKYKPLKNFRGMYECFSKINTINN